MWFVCFNRDVNKKHQIGHEFYRKLRDVPISEVNKIASVVALFSLFTFC